MFTENKLLEFPEVFICRVISCRPVISKHWNTKTGKLVAYAFPKTSGCLECCSHHILFYELGGLYWKVKTHLRFISQIYTKQYLHNSLQLVKKMVSSYGRLASYVGPLPDFGLGICHRWIRYDTRRELRGLKSWGCGQLGLAHLKRSYNIKIRRRLSKKFSIV